MTILRHPSGRHEGLEQAISAHRNVKAIHLSLRRLCGLLSDRTMPWLLGLRSLAAEDRLTFLQERCDALVDVLRRNHARKLGGLDREPFVDREIDAARDAGEAGGNG